MEELQRLVAAPADPGETSLIKERVEALQELETRTASPRCARPTDAIDEVLDVRQQARFRVFEDQIERRKLELLDARPPADPPQPRASVIGSREVQSRRGPDTTRNESRSRPVPSRC